MLKKLLALILLLPLGAAALGDSTITRLDQWASTSTPTTAISQRVWGSSIKLTGITTGQMLTLDLNSLLTASSTPFFQNFTFGSATGTSLRFNTTIALPGDGKITLGNAQYIYWLNQVGNSYSGSIGYDGSNRLRLDGAGGISLDNNLIFTTDNSKDIGASGATRPRNYYGGGDIITGGVITAGADLRLAGGDTGRISFASGGLYFGQKATNVAFFADTTYAKGFSLSTAIDSSTMYVRSLANNADGTVKAGSGLFSGNVGIGTTTPASIFHVANTPLGDGSVATTTVTFGAATTTSRTCFNVRDTTGAATSFYFAGTTMVVEANSCR